MSLQPIADCTAGSVLNITTSLYPKCNLTTVKSFDTYPSYFTCPKLDPDDRQFCYIVTNGPNDSEPGTGYRNGLIAAMGECCDNTGPGSFDSCFQFCTYPKDVESWNDCLSDWGYAPSRNDTGILRDTYCVPPVKKQKGGGDGSGGDAQDKTGGAASLSNAKAGLGIGLMLLACFFGSSM